MAGKLFCNERNEAKYRNLALFHWLHFPANTIVTNYVQTLYAQLGICRRAAVAKSTPFAAFRWRGKATKAAMRNSLKQGRYSLKKFAALPIHLKAAIRAPSEAGLEVKLSARALLVPCSSLPPPET